VVNSANEEANTREGSSVFWFAMRAFRDHLILVSRLKKLGMRSRAWLLLLPVSAVLCTSAAAKSPEPPAAKGAPVVLGRMVVSGKRIPSGWFTVAWECKGALPLDPIKRAWVSNLMPGSPAESAGVQIGDRILAVDEIPIEKLNGLLLRSMLEREHDAGSQMTFLLRSGKDAPRIFVVAFERGISAGR
jgi:hypothetical protein